MVGYDGNYTFTDSNGRYYLEIPEPGTYFITFSHVGFKLSVEVLIVYPNQGGEIIMRGDTYLIWEFSKKFSNKTQPSLYYDFLAYIKKDKLLLV